MLRKEVEKHIRKLTRPLKEESELIVILKAKLTKKEYKTLLSWAKDEALEPLWEKLSLDEQRYNELREKLIKKLNQEKVKHAMMV